MFKRIVNPFLTFGLLLSTAGIALAAAYTSSGLLHDTNTIDYVPFSAPQSSVISYTATGSGSGSNECEVKLQQQDSGGAWHTLDSEVLQMPFDVDTGSATVLNYLSGTTELLRWRLSRKALTKSVTWEVDWSY